MPEQEVARICLAVCLFLGGLGLGLGDFDHYGRSVAAALNWSGFVIGCGGLLLVVL